MGTVLYELVGYSLGGAKEMPFGEKFNLEGTHINPFLSPYSNYEIAKVNNKAKQEVVRIVNDSTVLCCTVLHCMAWEPWERHVDLTERQFDYSLVGNSP
jgi:hypothetical protein